MSDTFTETNIENGPSTLFDDTDKLFAGIDDVPVETPAPVTAETTPAQTEASSQAVQDLTNGTDITKPVEYNGARKSDYVTPARPQKKQKINYWSVDPNDVIPMTIDASKFTPAQRRFDFAFISAFYEVPDTIKARARDIAEKFKELQCTYRWNGNPKDEMAAIGFTKCKGSTCTYMPLSIVNKEITDPVLKFPTDDAFKVTKEIMSDFYNSASCRPMTRATNASYINVLFGKDLKTPVRVLFIYNKSTIEKPEELNGMDFKEQKEKIAYSKFVLDAAKTYGIPVINLNREDAVERVKQIVKDLSA